MQSRVIAPVNSTGLNSSIVSKEHHNGILGQTILLELAQNPANGFVHPRDANSNSGPIPREQSDDPDNTAEE